MHIRYVLLSRKTNLRQRAKVESVLTILCQLLSSSILWRFARGLGRNNVLKVSVGPVDMFRRSPGRYRNKYSR